MGAQSSAAVACGAGVEPCRAVLEGDLCGPTQVEVLGGGGASCGRGGREYRARPMQVSTLEAVQQDRINRWSDPPLSDGTVVGTATACMREVGLDVNGGGAPHETLVAEVMGGGRIVKQTARTPAELVGTDSLCPSCDTAYQVNADFCHSCGSKRPKEVGLKRCPMGHTLKSFVATDAFSCDRCRRPQPRSSTLYGCRACDFDLCAECWFRQEQEPYDLAFVNPLRTGGSPGPGPGLASPRAIQGHGGPAPGSEGMPPYRDPVPAPGMISPRSGLPPPASASSPRPVPPPPSPGAHSVASGRYAEQPGQLSPRREQPGQLSPRREGMTEPPSPPVSGPLDLIDGCEFYKVASQTGLKEQAAFSPEDWI